MSNKEKAEAWKKLKDFFEVSFKEKVMTGLCECIRWLRTMNPTISLEERNFLLSDIDSDLEKMDKYKFLFTPYEYEPRLKYLTDKIAEYEQQAESQD